MTVERVSENQLKFIFKTNDLAERDIILSEISFASDKTQQLFQEVLAFVQFESGFISGNTPLMLEASRVGLDSLVVLVTKVSEDNSSFSGERRINLVPAAKQKCKYKRLKELLGSKSMPQEDSYSLFSFDDIEMAAAAVLRLPSSFVGKSSAYKMDQKIYLVIKNATPGKNTTAEMESVLFEYGKKHVSNMLSHQFLVERAEVLIADGAVEKLRAYSQAQKQALGE